MSSATSSQQAAAEAAANKDLPRPWRAVWDADSKDFYYWNEDTDEVSWIRPTAQSISLPPGWTAVYDEESGDYFYWHVPSDKTQWEKPEWPAAGAAAAASSASLARAESARSMGPTDGEEESEAAAAYAAAGKRKNRQVIMAESYDPSAGGKTSVTRVEKPDASKAVIRAALQGSAGFLFSSMSPDELETVVMAMVEKLATPGEVIIKQGDKGDFFYVAETGSYSIFVGGTKVASRGAGDSFGELALLYNCPRAATIQADSPGRLWALDRVTFRYMVASTREGQLAEIVRGLRNVELLKTLTDEQINRLAEAVKVVTYKRGERIITKGEMGQDCFFVRGGRVRCFGATAAGKAMEDMMIGTGGHFGERALLLGAPRAANVESDEDGTSCYVLGRKEFNEMLGPLRSLLEQDLILRVLNSVPVLAALSKAERERVVSAFKARELVDKEVLVKVGSVLNTFFFVKTGGLKVVRAGKEETMGQGGYLGERALFKEDIADADFIATGPTTVFSLDRKTFESHVGTAATLMRRASGGPVPGAAVVTASGERAGAASSSGMPKRGDIRMADLEVMRTLGAGTFGRVKLVRHKPTDKPFALKVLQKAQVVAYAQQKNVKNERDVMMMVDHPFVLKLYQTFKDANCLYMLLEYVQGGELFTFLANTKLGYVSVDDARFYGACVLAGVEALHDKSILYRDLKPENMLIDAQGYIKVVDLGFAKVVRDRTYTLCGTPEYLAPELVLGQGHFKGVDYWAIGVLLYEMCSGHSPFYDPAANDQMVICKNIVKGKFSWPSHVKDSYLKDVVTKLLVRTVTNRLGCRKEGTQEIKDHKFFAPIDWDTLVAKKLKAPWLPPVKNPFDTSCFEAYGGPEDIQAYVDDGSGWDADF